MTFYTNLPTKSSTNSDSQTLQAFDAYYTAPLEVSVSTFDAVKGFFEQRGFEQLSANAVAIAIIRQSKIDNVNPMVLLDDLIGLDNVKLSNVVSEILNYNRFKTVNRENKKFLGKRVENLRASDIFFYHEFSTIYSRSPSNSNFSLICECGLILAVCV